MDHGHMGHGGMDMGGQCDMNVLRAVPPTEQAVAILTCSRCSSPGPPKTFASCFANGESLGLFL